MSISKLKKNKNKIQNNYKLKNLGIQWNVRFRYLHLL